MADSTNVTLNASTPDTSAPYVQIVDTAVEDFLLQNTSRQPVSVVHAASLPAATVSGKTLAPGIAMKREGDGNVYAKTFGTRSARVSIDFKG